MFPSPRDDAATTLIRSLLQSNDFTSPDAAVRSAELGRTLAALMLLKLERLRLEQGAGQQSSPLERSNVIVEGSAVWTGLRGTAVYFNEEKFLGPVHVLVEKKRVPSELRYELIHDKRICNLARLLSIDNKRAEMRTLGCLGVMSQMHDTHTTYKLLFRLPATTSIFTLKDILEG